MHCHRKCNEDKGALTLDQYREVIAMRQRLPVDKFRFPGETDEWIAYQKLARSHPIPLADTTKISWANHTWNPWIGCRKVTRECDHCYAESLVNRMRRTPQDDNPFATITRSTSVWGDPKRWQRKAAALGKQEIVFTCSLSDFFIQQADRWRDEAWDIIRDTPNMIYMILTKRPKLIPTRLPHDWKDGWPNVWLGVSVGIKDSLARMDELREVPARTRFVSAEPLLEDICPDLAHHVDGFHQIIVGGESGNRSNNFRPMPHEWARRILAICRMNNIAFFFKQSAASSTEMGTTLDGVEYKEYPAQFARQ